MLLFVLLSVQEKYALLYNCASECSVKQNCKNADLSKLRSYYQNSFLRYDQEVAIRTRKGTLTVPSCWHAAAVLNSVYHALVEE